MNFLHQKLGHLEGIFLQKYLFFTYFIGYCNSPDTLISPSASSVLCRMDEPCRRRNTLRVALCYLSLAFLAPSFAMEIFAGRSPVKYNAAVVGG